MVLVYRLSIYCFGVFESWATIVIQDEKNYNMSTEQNGILNGDEEQWDTPVVFCEKLWHSRNTRKCENWSLVKNWDEWTIRLLNTSLEKTKPKNEYKNVITKQSHDWQ